MDAAAGSGKGLADLNGYTMSMTGQDANPAYEVTQAIVSVLIVPAV